LQVIEVIHPNRPSVPRAELAATLAKTFKSSADHIITFGFKVAFGGGKASDCCWLVACLMSRRPLVSP
jgi:small subunit ribosomal protein S24e